MLTIAKRADRDSASLKVLSIITLIYLPSTIVMVRIYIAIKMQRRSWSIKPQGFYSTQFVSQTHSGVGAVVVYAQNWWLFFAITVPLTVLTLGTWYFWSRNATRYEAWKVSLAKSSHEGVWSECLRSICRMKKDRKGFVKHQEAVWPGKIENFNKDAEEPRYIMLSQIKLKLYVCFYNNLDESKLVDYSHVTRDAWLLSIQHFRVTVLDGWT